MIRIIKDGDIAKRKLQYYAFICPYCHTKLVAERKDIWIDDADKNLGRVECANPYCRLKVHVQLPEVCISIAEEVEPDVYNNAHQDLSKSGLQLLQEERKNSTEKE